MPTDKRALVGNLPYAIGLPLGGVIQAWLIKAVGDWTVFHHILFSQTFLMLLAPWFVKESPRWLICKGRIDEAVGILEDIAKENGQELDSNLVKNFKATMQQEYEAMSKVNLTVLDLFKSPVLRKNVILMIVNWSLTSALYEMNMRNIENLPYSIYLTFSIYSVLEFPSDIASIWGLDSIGRRWSSVLSLTGFFISAFVCVIFFQISLVVTVMGMVARLFITYAMNCSGQLTLEVVPTQLRGQGTALANVCAQMSNFFAPYVVYSNALDPRMPLILMGAFGLLAAVLALFLPETAGVKLPDTIEEAEYLFSKPAPELFQFKFPQMSKRTEAARAGTKSESQQ